MVDTEFLFLYFAEEFCNKRNNLNEIAGLNIRNIGKCVLERRGIISDYENKKEDK